MDESDSSVDADFRIQPVDPACRGSRGGRGGTVGTGRGSRRGSGAGLVGCGVTADLKTVLSSPLFILQAMTPSPETVSVFIRIAFARVDRWHKLIGSNPHESAHQNFMKLGQKLETIALNHITV